jgi:CheY-like chemotaxis protein
MKKILIADDDESILEVTTFYLRGSGYEVRTAADGAETLAKVRTLMPDLVLLDIMMPEVHGISVCEQIKKDPALRHIKVIIISSKAYPADRHQAHEAGADGFISKPFDGAGLLKAIADALA